MYIQLDLTPTEACISFKLAFLLLLARVDRHSTILGCRDVTCSGVENIPRDRKVFENLRAAFRNNPAWRDLPPSFPATQPVIMENPSQIFSCP